MGDEIEERREKERDVGSVLLKGWSKGSVDSRSGVVCGCEVSKSCKSEIRKMPGGAFLRKVINCQLK